MRKKLRSISLVLFSICCTIGFRTSVNAQTLEMVSDMAASEITISDGLVIDGKGEYTITGGLSIHDNVSITIKNVTLDGEGKQDILLNLINAGDVVIENVTFENYTKAGIYSEAITSLSVTGSTFDASDTKYIGNNNYEDNEERDFVLRSAAGIDLNLGSGTKTIDIKSITIKNNTFKNVVVADEDLTTSTAGAIKIKVKNATNLENIGTIIIEGNTFENNARDLVLGTNDPSPGTEASDTADLEVLLVNNSAMNVGNFSTTARAEEVLDGNYKLNYANNKKYALDENLYYIVDEDNIEALTEEEMAKILEDEDVAGFAVTIEGITFAISRETLLNEDLGASLDDFDIVLSEETAIEALKQYIGDGVIFFTISGIDLFDDGITYDVSSLGEEFVGTLYLYYYDETYGLQLVSSSEDTILAFDKNGTYVLSPSLISSSSSEEVENPQTFDALGIYAIKGIISVSVLASAMLYLKKRNA